ncbi:hypothetical protein IT415_01840 [bacterium]|nr:hypothetical protein [bacterium]
MRSVVALSAAVLLAALGVLLLRTTINEKVAQSCARGEEMNSFQSVQRDVYFVWQWLPSRDDSKSFIDCVGPATYISYRPYDGAALAWLGTVLALSVGLRDERKGNKQA